VSAPPTVTDATGVACGDGVCVALAAATSGATPAVVAVAQVARPGVHDKKMHISAANLKLKKRTKAPPHTDELAPRVL